MPDIDTTNKFIVALKGEEVLIIAPPHTPLSKADALLLAAWLVALAEEDEGEFAAVLAAVQNT